MIKWRPWPLILTKKFRVKLTIRGLRSPPQQEQEEELDQNGRKAAPLRVRAEVRWKGRPKAPLSPIRRSIRRNCTRDVEIGEDWNEEFVTVCDLVLHKGGAFHPWEVIFAVFNELNDGQRNKSSILGTALLNLAEFAFAAEERETDIQIPLSVAGIPSKPPLSIHLTISLSELETIKEFPEIMQRPAISVPSSPIFRNLRSVEKDEFSVLKTSLQKVKIFKEIVSPRKSKKLSQEDLGSEERCSSRSEDVENSSPFDMDSINGLDEGELEDNKDDGNIRKSFSYDSLASANYIGRSLYSGMKINGESEDWIYYSHRRSDVGCSQADEITDMSSSLILKRSILPWKKRKISFKSPKSKGELLLKDYGEEGGDDIDFDRRQMTSSNEFLGVVDDENRTNISLSKFGDDNFEVGRWETKEFISRDGHMKLSTQVFFASIDQRSERAAGESACTALVVVIADWLQAYQDTMPIKSELDRLIREGSSEWRNLCKDETYRTRFPDKHFDLETIIQARVRSLSVVPEKSFIGFFHPEVIEDDNNHFDFLHGAMSFDKIWDEINHVGIEGSSDLIPRVYIMSWNDHFFILKVEPEAYYIVDTLGERLYEGCQQAYILKFDKETIIRKMPDEVKGPSSEATESRHSPAQQSDKEGPPVREVNAKDDNGEDCICKGKETCKEYIKSFLAALPIRELLVDLKKGLMPSTPLHQLLQIDFHYTELSKKTMAPLLPQESEPVAMIEGFSQLVAPNEA